MQKNLKWKLLVILVIMLAGAYMTVSPAESGRGLFSRINLGLDLQGGIHLVLQVVTDEALEQEVNQDAERIAVDLRAKDIAFDSSSRTAGLSIELTGVDSARENEVRAYLGSGFERRYTVRSRTVEGKTTYTLSLMGAEARRLQESTVEQARSTVERRVNALGVAEPTIQIYGSSGKEVQDQIIVELPGVDDPERVKELIGRTAQLELRLVKKENGGPFTSIESAVQANGGRIPDGWEILPSRDDRAQQGQLEYMVVSGVPTITGRHLKNARRSQDSNGLPAVGFYLNSEGADIFTRTSEQHIGDRLAIVLDKVVVSAPVINERLGADNIIHGQFTVQQAEDLAMLLRSGALPASLRILEERTVGASLGNDSIRSGIIALSIGFLLVIVGMVIYYRKSGLNAIWCLLGNLILLLGFMGAVGATLTLPGIAGLLLTVGMAVDANILIFERIREEMRLGKSVRAAIDAGFERAFRTIFDTNTTTLIAAAFLFQFGTGPLRGFAVTLTVGLIANLFTAVWMSRRFFEWSLGDRKVETLSI